MNKRIFAAMAVAGLLFAGCSSSSSDASSAASGAGETSNTAYVESDGTEVSGHCKIRWDLGFLTVV